MAGVVKNFLRCGRRAPPPWIWMAGMVGRVKSRWDKVGFFPPATNTASPFKRTPTYPQPSNPQPPIRHNFSTSSFSSLDLEHPPRKPSGYLYRPHEIVPHSFHLAGQSPLVKLHDIPAQHTPLPPRSPTALLACHTATCFPLILSKTSY